MSALKNTLRLFQIGWVLSRHGAGFVLAEIGVSPLFTIPCNILSFPFASQSRGKRLAKGLQALGPTFIKLGQMLSTRADLVGEEIALSLGQLRDKLAPFPTSEAIYIIESDLRRPLADIFLSFDTSAVAAASVAQVHFATLRNGEEVAVKILRPQIEKQFARDIALLYWLADYAEENFSHTTRLKLREVVALLERTVTMEMDLRMEAAAAAKLKANLKNDPVHVPEIFWNETARRTLTMQRVEGIPINDLEALKNAGYAPDEIMYALATSFFNQVFRDGFFHADVHPGNVFVEKDGKIAFVDFGIMGRISKKDRMVVAEILHGFLQGDFDRVARIHKDAGYIPRHQSVHDFSLACRAIAEPILNKPLSEISVGALLGQLFKVSAQFEMQTQPQLLLLQKTMVMVEGVGRMLNPQVNMWKMAEPLIAVWAQENFGMKARASYTAQELFKAAKDLPYMLAQLKELVESLNTQGLRFSTENSWRHSRNYRKHQDRWLAFCWAALLAAIIIAGIKA